MTNFKFLWLLPFLFFCIPPIAVQAQFLDLRLDVDSKISARTEQPLHFGRLMTNTGRSEIEGGNVKMGIFSVTALEHQLLLVSMDIPSQLHHANTAITDVVPVELHTRYGYSYQDFESSRPLPQPIGNVRVKEDPAPGPWNSVFFFIYGSISVGDIAGGSYSNDIVLHVEYL